MAIEIKHPGKLHRHLGISKDKKIPSGTLQHLKSSGTPSEKKMANFAINAKKWNHVPANRSHR